MVIGIFKDIFKGPRRYLVEGISLRNGRPTNMDSIAMLERKVAGERMLLAVVCDGVGSLEDGGYAAAQTTGGLLQWFSELTSPERVGVQLRDQVLWLNQQILRETSQSQRESATTCSALLLVEGRYYMAHVGDSRIYAFHQGQLEQLTTDDVSESNELTACVGYDPDPLITCGQGQTEGRSFLLCSDGMYKRMSQEEAATLVRTGSRGQLRRSLRRLTETVVARGEKDNISIIIIKCKNQ